MEKYAFWVGIALFLVGSGLQITGYTDPALGVGLMILGALVAIFATIIYLTGGKKPTAPKVKMGKQLIAKLREYATEHSNAHVEFANHMHKKQAEELVSAFELAGWKTNFTSVPLEMSRSDYYEGVEVSGVNNHLVRTVEMALREAGFLGVKPKVNQIGVQQDSPKYESAQNRINILIGHQNLPT